MQQLLIDAVPSIDTSRSAARRAAMEAAKRRGERGIENVAQRAETERPGWCGDACEALRNFARAQGGVFTIEHARMALEQGGGIDKPCDGRAWGKAARMAKAAGFIELVKGQFFPAASSNGSPKPVYRKGVNA